VRGCRIGSWLPAVLLAAVGCGTSAPARFYTLDATATPSGGPALAASVLVGPVTIPSSVDRPQFVAAIAPNRVDIDDFNRWAAPLEDSIARVVADDLTTLLGTPDVAVAPMANFEPTYRVTIDVQRFESIPGEAALIDALWTLRATADGAKRTGRTVARESVQGEGFDALAGAHSRALARLSVDIAAAIRAAADAGP
jgi:uncharacterized protein